MARLVLEDGSSYTGQAFGASRDVAGEVGKFREILEKSNS